VRVMPRRRKLFGIHRPKRKPRRRRDPATARTELLDAAEQVFREFHPDQVGLVDVAQEAGVSHALVTHYFGTYDGLVRATLERRVRALRERVLVHLRDAGALSRPAELLALLFDALEDPVHLRLLKWLVAGERAADARAFALQDHGLQIIAYEVASELLPLPPPRDVVERIELALLVAVSAAFGYAIAKFVLATAIGRPSSPELSTDVRRTLAAMLETHVRAAIAPRTMQ
jgi:AcrR family transcriptional regulator